MSLRVLALDESGVEWDAALGKLPSRLRDVYFTSAYHLLWQRNGDGRACGAVFELEDGRVLYPFLRRRLSDLPWLGEEFAGLDDISSPYGYGGPLVDTPAERRAPVLAAFRSAFGAWSAEAGVVSEFVRSHPLLHTEEGLADHMDLVAANETVVCRVGTNPDEHLAAMSSTTRRNVRKAQRAGLEFAVEGDDEAYAAFLELYLQTMRRRDAAAFYLFDERHIADFRELLGDRQALLMVRHEGRPVAAALFMLSEHLAHYHLGGSDAEALELRPNNLLFFEAMSWAGRRGISELHLGGGYRAGGEDELFRFKAGFSPLRSRFFLGRAIHLRDAYERAQARRAAAGPGADSGFFPAYRAPLAT
jgi:Acetyltransferase (GNAT) domain